MTDYIHKQHLWACQVIENDNVWFYYHGHLYKGVVIDLVEIHGVINYKISFRNYLDHPYCSCCGSKLSPNEHYDDDDGLWVSYDIGNYKEITLGYHELVNPYL